MTKMLKRTEFYGTYCKVWNTLSDDKLSAADSRRVILTLLLNLYILGDDETEMVMRRFDAETGVIRNHLKVRLSNR